MTHVELELPHLKVQYWDNISKHNAPRISCTAGEEKTQQTKHTRAKTYNVACDLKYDITFVKIYERTMHQEFHALLVRKRHNKLNTHAPKRTMLHVTSYTTSHSLRYRDGGIMLSLLGDAGCQCLLLRACQKSAPVLFVRCMDIDKKHLLAEI